MEQEATRQLPYDVDVEQALLGAILVDNYSLERVSSLLKPEHFYDPLHQQIFKLAEQEAASDNRRFIYRNFAGGTLETGGDHGA